MAKSLHSTWGNRREPTHEEIQTAAVHLFLHRGQGLGPGPDDWMRAKRLLTEALREMEPAPHRHVLGVPLSGHFNEGRGDSFSAISIEQEWSRPRLAANSRIRAEFGVENEQMDGIGIDSTDEI